MHDMMRYPLAMCFLGFSVMCVIAKSVISIAIPTYLGMI